MDARERSHPRRKRSHPRRKRSHPRRKRSHPHRGEASSSPKEVSSSPRRGLILAERGLILAERGLMDPEENVHRARNEGSWRPVAAREMWECGHKRVPSGLIPVSSCASSYAIVRAGDRVKTPDSAGAWRPSYESSCSRWVLPCTSLA